MGEIIFNWRITDGGKDVEMICNSRGSVVQSLLNGMYYECYRKHLRENSRRRMVN